MVWEMERQVVSVREGRVRVRMCTCVLCVFMIRKGV